MNIPVDKYENWLKNKNLKDRTIEQYIYYLNKYSVEYPGFNQEYVNRFLANKSNRNGVARSFLASFRKFLKTNYKELGINEELRKNIVDVDLPKLTGRKKQRITEPLSVEQIEILEKFLESEELKLQLLLGYYCGLRVGSIIKLNIMSFDWDTWRKDTNKFGRIKVHGKGDKEYPSLVPIFLMRRLGNFIKSKEWESINSYLFVKLNPGEKLVVKDRVRNFQKKIREAGINSGITKLDGNGEVVKDTSVHPHRLRHSYGYYLRTVKNMDIMEIKELMGHSSVQSTQIYLKMDLDHLEKKLKD